MIPRNIDEYVEQATKATLIDGYGLEVTTHMPCPWCAFKDFMLLQPAAGIIPGDDRPSLEVTMQTEHTCIRCGRKGKNIVERSEGGVSFEFVQTGGPDAPEWLQPPPRRV